MKVALTAIAVIMFMMFGFLLSQTASASSDPAIYTNKGFQGNLPTANGVSYETRLNVNGQEGPFAVNSPAQPNSNAIIDVNQIKSAKIYQEVVVKNNSKSDQSVNFVISLPRNNDESWKSRALVSDQNWQQLFSDQNIKRLPDRYTSPSEGLGYYPSLDTDNSALVTSFHIRGRLSSGQDLTLKIPLVVSNSVSITNKTTPIKITLDYYDASGNDSTASTYASFSNIVRDSNGNSPLDSTGRYVAYAKDSNKKAWLLPESIQKLMPQMNRKDIKVNDFLSGIDATDYLNAQDQLWYQGGEFFVNLSDIQKAVQNNGYSVLFDNKGQYSHYTYRAIGNKGDVEVYDPTTNKPFDSYGKDGYGTVPVQLRQVIGFQHTKENEVSLPFNAKWDPNKYVIVYDHDTKPITLPSKDVSITGAPTDMTKDGTYKVTYTYKPDQVSKTLTVIVGNGGNNNNGGGNNNGGSTVVTPTAGSSSTNPNNSTNASSSSNTSSSTSTSTNNEPATVTSNNSKVAVKGESVYAVKKIGLYKSTRFTKANRLTWYTKQKRTKRPMFVVTGYKRTANGTLRYKVRDVNHGKKTAGKTGYITASRKYVVPVYYASLPKSKKITVIASKGVNSYKSVKLTGKVKHYKKGTHLTIKKLVKHNLTTRYQLSNGHYITANKKLVIAGRY